MTEKELHRGVTPFLTCKDHLVSNENYEVMFNNHFEMLVTSPVPSNLDKYYDSEEYQSHNNSSKSFLNLIYTIVKKRSFRLKKEMFKKTLTRKNILDIGAGTGDFLLYCKDDGFAITGVEPNKKARKQAQLKGISLDENLNGISKKKFEIITMWHVLEHVPNLTEYLEQLKLLLSEKGQLFIAVPNFKSFDADYYKEFWAAYDVPRHLWHFSQKAIRKLFLEAEMIVEETLPMKFDSYYVSLLSEKNKTGKSNPIKAFYRGFLSNRRAKSTTEYSSLIYVIKNN